MRRFDLGEPRHEPTRESYWWISVAIHVVVLALLVLVSWQAPYRPRPKPAPEVREWVVLPPVVEQRPQRAAPPAPPPDARQLRLQPIPVERQLPAPTEETVLAPVAPPTKLEHFRGPLVVGPQLGDGRPWVAPRPALPAAVADALYGEKDTIPIEVVIQRRLQAMMDTLNAAIDAEQRSGRKPTWATDILGVPFSMDSQFVTIAGVKVPNVALALLGSLLPAETQRSMEGTDWDDMRQDMLRAAQRTQTFKDFQKYVKETRQRKQAEREAARARANAPPRPAPPPPPPAPQPSDTIIP